MSRLTKQFIESIQPDTKHRDYPDQSFQGLVLRCHPTGKKTFYYRYRFNGTQRSIALGTATELSPVAARELASDAALMVRRGQCPSCERRAEAAQLKKLRLKTLRTYVDGPYKDKALQRPSGRGHESVAMVKTQYKSWLDLPMQRITPDMILKKRRDRQKKGIKQSTLRRNELELRTLLNMAVAEGVLDRNPLDGLPLLKEGEPRTRYLNQDEEILLRRELYARDVEGCASATVNSGRSIHGWTVPQCMTAPYTDHLTPAVILSLNTGMRAGELRQLLWTDISHDSTLVTLRPEITKNGKARSIPLNKEARDTLQRLRLQSRGRWLFTYCGDDKGSCIKEIGKRSYRAILRKAGITDCTWHDLRHSFASSLVMRKVPIIEVQQLLGHADLRMTLRYAHLAPSALADAVSVLDG